MKSSFKKYSGLISQYSAAVFAAYIAFTPIAFSAPNIEGAKEALDIPHDGAYDEAHSHDAGYGEVDGLPQLDFSTYTSQIFWMFIIFALLYFFVAKKTLPEISGTIEGRKNHIDADLDTAEKLSAEADAVHDGYKQGLQTAKNKAAETLQKSDDKMKAKVAKKQEEFRVKSEGDIEATEQRIQDATAKAMAEMNDVVAEVAATAVEKITGTKTDSAQVSELIKKNLSNQKAKAA